MNASAVVLVEDRPDDVRLTIRAFQKNSLKNEIVVLTDGAEALDFFFAQGAYADRDPSDSPALILLDLQLPKVGGLEVLSRIRGDDRTKLFPVVVLTSSDEEADLIASYENGCNSYVRKPVDFGQFSEAVRHLAVYWLLCNELPPTCVRS